MAILLRGQNYGYREWRGLQDITIVMLSNQSHWFICSEYSSSDRRHLANITPNQYLLCYYRCYIAQ